MPCFVIKGKFKANSSIFFCDVTIYYVITHTHTHDMVRLSALMHTKHSLQIFIRDDFKVTYFKRVKKQARLALHVTHFLDRVYNTTHQYYNIAEELWLAQASAQNNSLRI